MKKISSALLKTIDVMCVVLLAAIFFSITLQIFARFTPLAFTWTEEFARVCFVIMSYLAAPLCLAEGSHIAIDMLVNILPKGIKRVVDVLIYVVVCFFCVVFIKSSIVNLGTNVGVSTITMTWLQMNWIYSAEIIAFVITFAIAAIQCVLTLMGKESTMVILEPKEDELSEEDLGL